MKDKTASSGSGDDKIASAIRLIEELDQQRNLGSSVPMIIFIGSGSIAVGSFFILVDFSAWLGLGKLDPVLPSSTAFILIFVVWLMLYLFSVTVLYRLGFKDIRTSARHELLKLELTDSERLAIGKAIASRTWRHNRLISGLADDMM